jgi:hypothetical protein
MLSLRLMVWSKILPELGRARPRRDGYSGYGAETPVLEWKSRLVCVGYGSRKIDMVVSGDKRH